MSNYNSDLKKSILIICPFPLNVAAGQRLKYEQYFSHWEDNGYEITVSSFMNQSMWKVVYLKGRYLLKIIGTIVGYFYRFRDLFRIYKYDIVYVHMWVTPFGSTLFERIVRTLSKKLIYDIEDNTVTAVSNGSVNNIIAPLKNLNKNKFLMKRANYVITSSPTLNKYCAGVNNRKKCKYISSSINTDKFLPVNTYSNNKKVTIGWTGTFSSKEYLDLLKDVLIDLKSRCDFKLLIIGNFKYEFPEMDIEVIQWSSKNEVSDMQKIDIGIYPLSDDPWVYGKSGLKAIQYMSFGLPTVATNIGTTPQIIKNMKNGCLVDSDKEWIDTLEELIKNPKLRKSLGQAARKTVVDRYSIGAVKAKYFSIISEIYGK
ncbi:MAG: glycosyltransferase [Lentimicrobiaceae bacterium]|mgnify:FL=1|jgi:L-malate glycosyltransferase|nr:glycosyltransferase [Lentimicrobiaceae bacterium]